MKTILSLLFLSIFSTAAFSQDPVIWEGLKLKSKSDYRNAEPEVKKCVAYLLEHRYDKDEVVSRSASRLLLRWMTGTKEYHFSIYANIGSYYTEDESTLLIIYMAALAKMGFESPAALADQKTSETGAFKIIAEYCEKPENKVKQTPAVRKLIKANHDGDVARVLIFAEEEKKK
jgi:hypothetical protein